MSGSSIDRLIVANLCKVIDSAERTILIVSGALTDRIYSSRDVVESIKRATDKAVKFEVLVGPNVEETGQQSLLQLGNYTYVLGERPPLHFAIADGVHVRYEGLHDMGHPMPNALAMNAPRSAAALTRVAQQIKKTLGAVPYREHTRRSGHGKRPQARR